MTENLEFLLNLEPWGKRVEIALVEKCGDRVACAEPLVMKVNPDEQIIKPSFSISPKAAQSLVDELWRCGFRPSEGSGSAGKLAAVQDHLKDMRSLVFVDTANNNNGSE